MARRHGLILAALLFGAPPAQATPIYPLYGTGSEPLRPGVLAAEVSIDAMPLPIAARPDGVVAFAVQSSVYWVRDGRVVRVPVPGEASDLAFAPSGELLVASCPRDRRHQAAGVFRTAPGRAAVLIAGRGAAESKGDGGPAVAASFICPNAIAVEADSGILVADGNAGRVRRIGPDGVIRTVAGTIADAPAHAGDGGPAVRATLPFPADVASLGGGAFAVLDRGVSDSAPDRICLVAADGTIRTLFTGATAAIAGAADGALLVLAGDGSVRRLGLDGSLATIAGEPAGITPYVPLHGDPFGSDDVATGDIEAAPDGGVLLSTDFAVRYLPPPAPELQAVALLPATRRRGDSLTVSLRTTRPARVTVGVWRGGRRAALVSTEVPGGEAAVAIPGPLVAGSYRVHVQAAGPGGIAAASATVLVGRLPLNYARGVLVSRLELFETFLDERPYRVNCRRMGSWRIDCAMRQAHDCVGVATMVLERDGSLTLATYEGCRFRPTGGPPRRMGPVTH